MIFASCRSQLGRQCATPLQSGDSDEAETRSANAEREPGLTVPFGLGWPEPGTRTDPMSRSLRGRLIVLLFLLAAAAVAAGTLMVGLFRQSSAAQVVQADA